MIVAVVGDGFIARAVANTARAQGHGVRVVRDLVVHDAFRPQASVGGAVDEWLRGHPTVGALVSRRLQGCDAVVNAAGHAQPASGDVAALYDANAVLPGIIARIAAGADVARLVHVSTAAVQGRRDPLDESATVAPFSPYSRSKAAGERILLDCPEPSTQVTVYRPTSIQSAARPITQRLLRRAATGRLVVPGDGNAPIPVCLIENVAAGILHTAAMTDCPPIVLQPWEQMTARSLLEAIGLQPVFVPIPPAAIRTAAGLILTTKVPRLMAPARRIEMLALGQRQVASVLERSGFRAPVGPEGYRRLRRLPNDAAEPIAGAAEDPA